MKKGIAVIVAVAIIGTLGIYGKSHSSGTSSNLPSNNTATMADNTSNSDNVGSSGSNASSSSALKDGTFTGDSENTPYGLVQIAVVISGGKITDVNFLQMPNDFGHSQQVTSLSEPLLKQETLQSQNSNIDFISGASSTSEGYIQSLQSALDQAVVS